MDWRFLIFASINLNWRHGGTRAPWIPALSRGYARPKWQRRKDAPIYYPFLTDYCHLRRVRFIHDPRGATEHSSGVKQRWFELKLISPKEETQRESLLRTAESDGAHSLILSSVTETSATGTCSVVCLQRHGRTLIFHKLVMTRPNYEDKCDKFNPESYLNWTKLYLHKRNVIESVKVAVTHGFGVDRDAQFIPALKYKCDISCRAQIDDQTCLHCHK